MDSLADTEGANLPKPVSLAGEWRFALDREAVGTTERWFTRDLPGRLQLPGTLQAQGYGDEVQVNTRWTGDVLDRSFYESPSYAPYRVAGAVKVPFFLQPKKHYVGRAWYQRVMSIPDAWRGYVVTIEFERPHGQTSVWIGERALGQNNALGTPHRFVVSVGDVGLPTGEHRLTVCVDNAFHAAVGVGVNAHSISDHTQGNWNGIVGDIVLRAEPALALEPLELFPDLQRRSVRVRGAVRRPGGADAAGSPGGVQVQLEARLAVSTTDASAGQGRVTAPAACDALGRFEAELRLGAEAPLWSEFNPVLWTVTARLASGATVSADCGLREVSVAGRQLRLNGQKLFLRGALDCAIFPRLGHPPTDLPSWREVLGVVKAHGLNHVRFHSWCPPRAAFCAADRLGLYLQVECGTWPNHDVVRGPASERGLGDGDPVDEWLLAEGRRILREYGNHPSFLFLAAGNEPGGKTHPEYLGRWIQAMKAIDGRRLYTGTAGWPSIPENDFHVTPEPRIHQWGDGLASRINARPPETLSDYRAMVERSSAPLVAHEIGQWCAYPDFRHIGDYTGPLQARNLEIFAETAQANGLADQAESFAHASGKLQTLCYKEEIEAALRTPGFGGFQLLGLQDFSGQGTALVGVVDAFWKSKGYISPEEYRRFCGPTVPLARLPKRVFSSAEALAVSIEVAHFGARPMEKPVLSWRVVDEHGTASVSGEFPTRPVPIGNGHELGTIDWSLESIAAPAKYVLIVTIEDPACGRCENSWEFWVYPRADATKTTERIYHELNPSLLAELQAGAAVVLQLPPCGSGRGAANTNRGLVLGFSPIFWNTAWTTRQAPHTLGLLCDPRHPALSAFPTEKHSNWHWWHVVAHAWPMILDGIPEQVRPVVSVIDDWFTQHRLALVVEARVGRGRLLVTSVDLSADDLVVQQLRRSLLGYLASDSFRPEVELNETQLRRLQCTAES